MQGLLYYGYYSSKYSDVLPYIYIGKDSSGRGGYAVSSRAVHLGPFKRIIVTYYNWDCPVSCTGTVSVAPVTAGNKTGSYPTGTVARGSVQLPHSESSASTEGDAVVDVSGVNEACYIFLLVAGNWGSDSDMTKLFVKQIRFE